MNVFEDLVVELKQENLLEDTVVDTERAVAEADASLDITDEPDRSPEADGSEKADHATAENIKEAVLITPKPPKDSRSFFNNRAIAEVSSLQMVEHVVTGVEREYLKIVPKSFDDFNAKKALNAFLHVQGSADTEEHKKAEFDLMHETQAWATALGERDRNVPVSALRQYCDNSKPALSSQALLALGRFYRNSAYSENVRAKFDFVITRLFSRPGPGEGRTLLFDRDGTLDQINRLYADWSSVPLYTADADESNVLLTALSFEDLAREAENASNFDQLLKSDFFGRVRLFKESITELFYAPNVIAAAVECNIRIGNAYVQLIQREREKLDADSLRKKYGVVDDQSVSDAAAWTLKLNDISRQGGASTIHSHTTPEDPVEHHDERPAAAPAPKIGRTAADEAAAAGLAGKLKSQLRTVNKWVLISCSILLLASAGLFVWANYFAGPNVPSAKVRSIPLDGNFLSSYLRTAKVSGDTFYGLLLPGWDTLPKDKRTEILQNSLTLAQQQGAKQVTLIASDGKQAGYASATKIDVETP